MNIFLCVNHQWITPWVCFFFFFSFLQKQYLFAPESTDQQKTKSYFLIKRKMVGVNSIINPAAAVAEV